MDSEKVYLSMLGELVYPLRDIPNAFGPGTPCEKLYQQIYESKRRLCNRLNADEDPDVEAIGDCFWENAGIFPKRRYARNEEKELQRTL